MVAKDIAKNVIDSLPEQATIDDIMHALYVKAKFERGEKEIENGKGVSHDEAKRKMQKWLR